MRGINLAVPPSLPPSLSPSAGGTVRVVSNLQDSRLLDFGRAVLFVLLPKRGRQFVAVPERVSFHCHLHCLSPQSVHTRAGKPQGASSAEHQDAYVGEFTD